MNGTNTSRSSAAEKWAGTDAHCRIEYNRME